MQDLKVVYKNLMGKKKERKELQKMIADELRNSAEYQTVTEELKTLREKKKSIEDQIKALSFNEAYKIDELSEEIKENAQMLSDLALNMYANNQSTEIVDEYNTRWVPEFKVNYKKEQENVEGVAELNKGKVTTNEVIENKVLAPA